MPATFKAAVLTEFKTPIIVREFSLLQSIDPGGALVRVQMAGVCGTDVHLWKGQLPIPRPNILGHETLASLNSAGNTQTGLARCPIAERRPGHLEFVPGLRPLFLLQGKASAHALSESQSLWHLVQLRRTAPL
jgi:hypothetical protein